MAVMLSEEAFEELVGIVQRVRELTGEGVENASGSIDISPQGLVPSQQIGGRGAAQRLFRVQSVKDDHLVCRRYDARNDKLGPKDVAVAKPWMLRKSSLDGRSGVAFHGWSETFDYSYDSDRKRTVTRNSDAETQTEVVTPDYLTDDGSGNGETIVAVYVPTGLKDADGKGIVWLDLNEAGRLWAKISDKESS